MVWKPVDVEIVATSSAVIPGCAKRRPGISRFRSMLEPVTGPRIARTRWHRPGMTSSSRGAPAIDRIGRAGYVARLVGGEEGDDGCDLRRLSETARGNPLDDLLQRRRVAGLAGL